MISCDQKKFNELSELIEKWMLNEEDAGREITSKRASMLALFLCAKMEDKNE